MAAKEIAAGLTPSAACLRVQMALEEPIWFDTPPKTPKDKAGGYVEAPAPCPLSPVLRKT